LDDDRFQKIFTSSEYALDPTHPSFTTRQTEGMKMLQKERTRRRGEILLKEEERKESEVEKKGNSAEKSELASLVSAVKNKSQTLRTKK